MSRINRALLMMIAMVVIMIAAVGIDKGYDVYQARRWEKERVAVYARAKADIEEMQTTIKTLSQDPEALISYIEENQFNYREYEETGEESGGLSDHESGLAWSISGNEGSISGNGGSISGNAGSISGNGSSISGNEGSISGNGSSISGNAGSISGNGSSISGNEGSISGNGGSISGNEGSISGSDGVSGNDSMLPGSVSPNTVHRKRVAASYAETLRMNASDKQTISGRQMDFSDMKIACLGDSITAGSNLSDTENYQQFTYPCRLKEALGAEEVVNLGIGGSSIGRYWENAFVDRYQEIPEDVDLILIMGGTNDGFCASEEELGTVKEREENTFAGDLAGLLSGLQKDYPEAKAVLITPLPNVLHDMLRRERDYLLPQSAFVSVMLSLAAEYEIPVIDLYHTNFLDTHDPAVIHNFMPDGVHGNEAGYEILAQHVAAELIRLYEGTERQEAEQADKEETQEAEGEVEAEKAEEETESEEEEETEPEEEVTLHV